MDEDQKMKLSAAALMFALMVTAPAANATDSICEAVAVHATKESEDFPHALKRGETIGAITQYNVNRKTGVATLCSHGGGCYPAEALSLTNCEVNKSQPAFEDTEEISYSLDLIRSKVPPATLRQNDVELKLLDLGMCNGCAANAAWLYVKKPNSHCAKLVLQALEGNPTAIEKLKATQDLCATN